MTEISDSTAVSDVDFGKIPNDFPRPSAGGAVSGFQNKLLLVGYDGKYYKPGCTPPELYARWDICEDLVQKLLKQCLNTKAGKRASMPEVEIVQQYYERSLLMGWGSPAEMQWIFMRVSTLLGWPVRIAAIPGDKEKA